MTTNGIIYSQTNMNRHAELSIETTDIGIAYRVRCYEHDDLIVSRVYSILEIAQTVKQRWEWGCTFDELD